MQCSECVHRGIFKDPAHLWCHGKGKFTVIQDNCLMFKTQESMSDFIFEGKIIAKGETREGVSQATGQPWKSEQYIIQEESGNYPMKMSFDVFGEDRIREFNLQLDDHVKVHFSMDSHQFNGRWFNNIRAWKVERYEEQLPELQPKAPQPVQAETKKDDELPF